MEIQYEHKHNKKMVTCNYRKTLNIICTFYHKIAWKSGVYIIHRSRQGCEWDVWSRDWDEIETLEWRYRDETETSVPPVRDDTEMRYLKQCLETFSWDVPAVTIGLQLQLNIMC